MTFKDGKLIETNNQFAIGDAKAYAARIGAGNGHHSIYSVSS
jgi:hypothetical protein